MEPVPRCSAQMSVLIEQMGFDIVLCVDTQNLSADPYGQLSLIANATSKLKMGTGVTHPVTREAAVTASAMAGLFVALDVVTQLQLILERNKQPLKN